MSNPHSLSIAAVCLAVALCVRLAAGPRQLYTVLEQQRASVGGALMGSEYTYAVPGQDAKKPLSIAAQVWGQSGGGCFVETGWQAACEIGEKVACGEAEGTGC